MATQTELAERFQALIQEHRGILYKVCNSYCRSVDDREDLAQEIAIQLWRSFPKFDGSRRFSTWMYQVALNVAISFYRRESTHARYVLSAGERFLDPVDESIRPSSDLAQLHQFIDRLDPLNKAMVLLYLDGHNYREIGEVLGLSESNVATKMSRLKEKL